MKYLTISLAVIFSFNIKADVIKFSTGQFAPCTDSKDVNLGWCTQVLKEALLLSGHRIEVNFFPWKRAMALVENNVYDCTYIWSYKSERTKRLEYNKEPILTIPEYVFFHRKDFDFDWKNWSDLKNLNIGLTTSYNYGTLATLKKADGYNINFVPTDLQNMKKLVAGRIDLFPLPLRVGKKMLDENFSFKQRQNITYHKKAATIKKDNFLLCTRGKTKSAMIMNAFDEGLRTLKKNGRYQEILDKYNVKL